MDKPTMRLAALILTGGRSQRMGSPKEFLSLGGDTFLGRTTATLRQCCDPVVVVRRSADQALPPLPGEPTVIADEQPLAGPLAAMATGMRHLRRVDGFGDSDAVFATGCDSPFLSAAVVQWLAGHIDEADLAIPVHGGIHQTLCAVYRMRTLDAIDALLARGVPSLRAVIEAVIVREFDASQLLAVDPELRSLTNVNTSDDYDRLREGRPRS